VTMGIDLIVSVFPLEPIMTYSNAKKLFVLKALSSLNM
jgi:hypothetical protein